MATPRVGLGIHTRTQTPLAPEAVLSTAPASPTEDMPTYKPGMTEQGEMSSTTSTAYTMPQYTAMGQVSFGPAIQKTVTTVTTFTTTDLPPLIINPPKDLLERDPKMYPLAYTPTPGSIKRFEFDYHGQRTNFHEAEDPNETMKIYQDHQARVRRHNGSIRHEERQEDYKTPVRGFKMPGPVGKALGVRASNAPKRTATPPSITEAAELASLQRRTKKPRSSLYRTHSESFEQSSLNQRTASGAFAVVSDPSPITPDTENGPVGVLHTAAGSSRNDGKRRRSPTRPSKSRLHQVQDGMENDVNMADTESQEDDSQLGPPFYGKYSKKKRTHKEDDAVLGASLPSGAAATPPVVDPDLDAAQQEVEHRRPHLPAILTSSQLDASLPSPSLSPITAAANAASRHRNTFDDSFAEHNEENASIVSQLDLEDESKMQSARSFNSQGSVKVPDVPRSKPIHGAQRPQPAQPAPSAKGLTIMDIPTMVDAFDNMPEAMQNYLMYQLLRRCAKPTLQIVANVVNPALKCDPFNVLPPELGLNIARFLDAQSMCRAAQVSRRWRKLINSDEKAWKDLLDRDDFVLPQNEVARAVKEGWGWQHPGRDGYEEDLSRYVRWQTPESVQAGEGQGSLLSEDEDTASSTVTAKVKRRSTSKYSGPKKAKRRTAQASASVTKPTTSIATWRLLLANAHGPDGYAHAAASAVPHPSVGLPGLMNMHLFKSLYQRHYLIREAWMSKESQPQHLAFRAHHRHVVTCLLFDGDKILTGSDDTKINVYDTKTGALRNRLEGHEGGVWALQYEGNTLVSGSTDRSVRVWDIKSGRCLQVFQGHTSTVRCLVILQPVQIGTEENGTPIMMPKEPLIITGSRDSTLRVWKLPQPGDASIFQAGPPANDRDNPYFLRTLSGHHNSVRAIAAHGDTLISGSYDCTVRVWKISTGDLVHRLQGHTQKVYSVVLDHARNRCISGSMDNLVKVWDLQDGACLFNLEGHNSLVGLLDLSHDRLVSAAADSTLRVWDPESGVCKATLSAHTGAITCFQHDGQKVISGSDRTLKMWNVRNGDCVRDLLRDLSGVWQVRFDERRCVAAVQRNSLTYIEVLDFGASRDGIPQEKRGRRIVVDCRGREIEDVEAPAPVDPDAAAAAGA